MRYLILLLAVTFFTPAAFADSLWAALPSVPMPSDEDDGDKAKEDKFTGSVELGYLASSGNSETTSLNSKLVLQYEQEVWRHGFMAQAIRATTDDTLTAERYQAAAKSDYKFSEYNYLFATVNYVKDEFSGYQRRLSEAVGYGRRLIETTDHVLDVEIGVGARQVELVDGTEQSDGIVRFSGNYQWAITDSSSFTQTLAVEAGDANTFSESVSSLTANLMGNLALKVSYTIRSNSEVPVGTEETDTYTAVSLLYTF